MRSRQQVQPDPECLITMAAEEEPSDPPADPSVSADDTTADQDHAASQDTAHLASQTSQPHLLSSQQPPLQPLHQQQPLHDLIPESMRPPQSSPEHVPGFVDPPAVKEFMILLEQPERQTRQQLQHQAKQKPKQQLQDVTLDRTRGQAAPGAGSAHPSPRQAGGADVNGLVEARIPVTGQELAMVDDSEDAGDDMMEIVSAEEGERERARLADRFLAVQVGSAVPTAHAASITTSISPTQYTLGSRSQGLTLAARTLGFCYLVLQLKHDLSGMLFLQKYGKAHVI